MSGGSYLEDDRGLLVGGALVVVFVFGMMCWQMLGNREDSVVRTSGFDLADGGRPVEPPRSSDRRSSLGMAEVGADLEAAAAAPPPARTDAPLSFKEAAQKNGAGVSAFTARFKQRHPIMREYSREWMRYPDLKKLNDDYMRDRDPRKFLDGLASSRNFGLMVKKVAADPATTALAMEFLTGVVKEVPAGLMSSAAGLLNSDKTVGRLAGTVAGALGVPPGMLSALTGGALDPKTLSLSPAAPRTP